MARGADTRAAGVAGTARDRLRNLWWRVAEPDHGHHYMLPAPGSQRTRSRPRFRARGGLRLRDNPDARAQRSGVRDARLDTWRDNAAPADTIGCVHNIDICRQNCLITPRRGAFGRRNAPGPNPGGRRMTPSLAGDSWDGPPSTRSVSRLFPAETWNDNLETAPVDLRFDSMHPCE